MPDYALMYRVPSPKLVKGKGFCAIQDHGVLQPTTVASNRAYLFTPEGTASRAMALIGTLPEIQRWAVKFTGTIIDNRIANLPDIYMGVCPYVPVGGRFTARSAGDAVVKKITNAVSSKEADSLSEKIAEGSIELWRRLSGRTPNPMVDMRLYVKFHFLPEPDLELIGTRTATIGDVMGRLGGMIKSGLAK